MKRTLEDKLLLPYCKADLGCGLNRHEKEKDEFVYIDAHGADGIDIVCEWDNIPIPDESFNEIHSSDTIEHLEIWKAVEILQEWKRIMKPGGLLWGTTPSFLWACKIATEGDLENAMRMIYGDRASRFDVHYTTHTKESLTKLLSDAGFVDIDLSESPGEHPYWWLYFKCRKPI